MASEREKQKDEKEEIKMVEWESKKKVINVNRMTKLSLWCVHPCDSSDVRRTENEPKPIGERERSDRRGVNEEEKYEIIKNEMKTCFFIYFSIMLSYLVYLFN